MIAVTLCVQTLEMTSVNEVTNVTDIVFIDFHLSGLFLCVYRCLNLV